MKIWIEQRGNDVKHNGKMTLQTNSLMCYLLCMLCRSAFKSEHNFILHHHIFTMQKHLSHAANGILFMCMVHMPTHTYIYTTAHIRLARNLFPYCKTVTSYARIHAMESSVSLFYRWQYSLFASLERSYFPCANSPYVCLFVKRFSTQFTYK